MNGPRCTFEDDRCTCDHSPGSHEAGFGCTESVPEGHGVPSTHGPDVCLCLAGWSVEPPRGSAAGPVSEPSGAPGPAPARRQGPLAQALARWGSLDAIPERKQEER